MREPSSVERPQLEPEDAEKHLQLFAEQGRLREAHLAELCAAHADGLRQADREGLLHHPETIAGRKSKLTVVGAGT